MTKSNYIHPNAKIGENVTISPFCYIDENVEIGEGTWIGPNVTIFSGARIGKNCKIFPGAIISGIPQDLKFKGEETTAIIGDNTVIREFVTINRGTSYAYKTEIGSNCLLMAYVHIAHDCILGNNIVLANNVNLAGHVQIHDHAIVEGMVGIQQFVHVGMHTFIGAMTLIRKSVPPYVKAAREPLSFIGVNAIGLRRRGFSEESVNIIKEIYRILFVKGLKFNEAIQEIQNEIPNTEEKSTILNFIQLYGQNGLMKGLR
jgi:UDP-N-acetylglucosamine acyltransferase